MIRKILMGAGMAYLARRLMGGRTNGLSRGTSGIGRRGWGGRW